MNIKIPNYIYKWITDYYTSFIQKFYFVIENMIKKNFEINRIYVLNF